MKKIKKQTDDPVEKETLAHHFHKRNTELGGDTLKALLLFYDYDLVIYQKDFLYQMEIDGERYGSKYSFILLSATNK